MALPALLVMLAAPTPGDPLVSMERVMVPDVELIGEGASNPFVPVCVVRAPMRAGANLSYALYGHVFHADDETFQGTYNGSAGNAAGWSYAIGRQQNVTFTECTTAIQDGVYSKHWLVGPLHSTGGWDWWQTLFKPYFVETRFEKSQTVYMGGFGFSYHAGMLPSESAWPESASGESTPADAYFAGTRLGYPPIHTHHSQFLAGSHQIFLNQNVDPLCMDTQFEGPNCFGSYHLISKGYAFLADKNIFAQGEGVLLNNDVRPEGSPLLAWYANLSISFIDPAFVRSRRVQPLNQLAMTLAFRADTQFATYSIPKGIQSFAAAESQWQFDLRPVCNHSFRSYQQRRAIATRWQRCSCIPFTAASAFLLDGCSWHSCLGWLWWWRRLYS
jgi:hypothetical protein